MTWTTAETSAVASLKSALQEAGFTDGRSTNATADSLLYFRDFIDDAALQAAATYFLFVVQPESSHVDGDNGKIAYEVSLDCFLATTYPPENSAVVSLRKSIEEEAIDAGFIVRFERSSFDPDLKMYVFEYRMAKEV